MGDMADYHLEQIGIPSQGDDPEDYDYKEGDKCYACNGTFRLRLNSFEDIFFLGCSNYPKCKVACELLEQPNKF